jgi:hypothetical protein
VIDAPTPFFARAHKAVLVIAVASLVFGIFWGIAGDDFDYVRSNGANGYSRSALGFQALAELLQARGVPVVRSRFHTGERIGPADVVVLAAPDGKGGDTHYDEIQKELLGGDHRVLLVLPKWRPSRKSEASHDPDVARVVRVDDARVKRLLDEVDRDAEIVRPDAAGFPLNGFGAEPEIDRPQLVRSDELLPLVGGDEGILVGEKRRAHGRLALLSDPDLVANCGLGRGENAALALALVESLRGEGGSVLFDETLHGLEKLPSVWAELIRWPLKLGSAHVALLFVAAVLAGALRFGRPRPLRGGWREGKEALLGNIADLMERVGHVRVAVGRYFDTTVERLAEYHHAPRTLERPARLEWVAGRLGGRRGAELRDLAAAAHAAGPVRKTRRSERAAMLELAARIHRFREEVLHGAR